MELDGRRWVVGTFGDLDWCRNMRANRNISFERGGRPELLTARELSPAEAAEFFRELMPRAVGRMRPFSRVVAKVFIRFAAPDTASDPELAATRRPVFELVPR